MAPHLNGGRDWETHRQKFAPELWRWVCPGGSCWGIGNRIPWKGNSEYHLRSVFSQQDIYIYIDIFSISFIDFLRLRLLCACFLYPLTLRTSKLPNAVFFSLPSGTSIGFSFNICQPTLFLDCRVVPIFRALPMFISMTASVPTLGGFNALIFHMCGSRTKW